MRGYDEVVRGKQQLIKKCCRCGEVRRREWEQTFERITDPITSLVVAFILLFAFLDLKIN